MSLTFYPRSLNDVYYLYSIIKKHMKELATQIQELNKYLDKNPWDMIKRTERYELIDKLCNQILNS